MKKLYLFIMFAVLASLGFANAATVTDVLTANLFTATESSYTDFSNVTVTSSAVYAGNSAKSDNGAIQLRSKKNNSGIVTTASAGTVKKSLLFGTTQQPVDAPSMCMANRQPTLLTPIFSVLLTFRAC